MPQKPLDISTSLFYPRAEEQQASLPGEQPYDADAARIHKSVRVCSHMVHQRMRCKKLQRVFYCNLSKKVQSGAPSGDENRAAARSAVRNATVRRSLARGRVPGNVAGVERRGDGERQGLEIKKCKFARVFMATISLMVVCCEIFRIEENWGKRRGEGTPPYGRGRVRCGFLMCGTAGRGVVG